jgi:hypothetical protein
MCQSTIYLQSTLSVRFGTNSAMTPTLNALKKQKGDLYAKMVAGMRQVGGSAVDSYVIQGGGCTSVRARSSRPELGQSSCFVFAKVLAKRLGFARYCCEREFPSLSDPIQCPSVS